ncbi:MAG: hypothetical protein RQ806_01435 [Erythrobacter sp.]|nr:hypothetical protein [Erythrobacter sp.]
MVITLLAAAFMVQAAPATAPALSQENRALLRCAAAFAVVANGQANSEAAAQQWPDLSTRGREFFVLTMAQLMDASGLDRAGITQLARDEAQALIANDEVHKIMPTCLLMLESSGV